MFVVVVVPVLTNSIGVGSINDLVLIRLHDFKATNGAGFRQARRWVVGNDIGHRVGVRLVSTAVQQFAVTAGAAVVRFELTRMIVLGNGDNGTAILQTVGHSAAQLLIRRHVVLVWGESGGVDY